MMKQKFNIIEWSMRKRSIVFLITGFLIVAGVIAFIDMSKQEIPEFTIRQGVIIGVYPSANSLEVEQQLTKPLERYLFTFPDVNREKTHSKSKDGITYIFVELADNVKDKDVVWSKIKHGLDRFRSSLPSGVMAVIANDNFGDVSSLLITLESNDKTYRELDGYADVLEDRLRRLQDVANVLRYGSQKEQITIYVDNDKLAAYGVGQKMLTANLVTQNFIAPSGYLDNDFISAPIHIAESYRSEQEIAEQIIFSDPQGNVVRVKDIARVVREYPKADSYITNNGKKCIIISVEVRHDANIIEFGKQINAVLKEFQTELPDSVDIYRIADQPKVVTKSISVFLRELLMAIVAVILVIMILLPFRMAFVSAIAIPFSILISLLLMYVLHIPLNLITLAALILVLGIIVDDSVVIVDNYIDKLDKGMERWEATITSATEYFKSIFTATLAISITFIPFIITTSGQTKDFLVHFPWTICIVLGVSLFVAVMLIPVIQYFFIKKGLKQKQGKNILSFVQNVYERILNMVFAHPKITLGIGIASVLFGIILFVNIPVRMMPTAVRDSFAVEIYLPQGSPLNKTVAICDSMETILRADKRVISVTSFKGMGSPRFHFVYAPNMPSKSYGQFIVNTVSEKATEELLDEYASRYAFYFPEAHVRFKQLDFHIIEALVEVRFIGDNLDELKQQGEKMRQFFNSLDECLWVRTSFEDMVSGVDIELDPVEAGQLGINRTTTEIALSSGLTGINISTLWEDDYAMPIRLQPENTQPNFGDIPNVHVSGILGSTVPLRQLADVKPEWTEGQITHRNGLRTLTVFADLKRDADYKNVYEKLKPFVNAEILPKLPPTVQLEYGGMPELEKETFIPLLYAILIALAMIFLILIFHCPRLKIALTIMLSMLFSIIGAAFGVWIMGIEFSITGMLGIVTLFGIIVRNGIIMLDYAEKLRNEQHLSVREAAYESAKRRMRPVFLTSAAASMGVLPMVISQNLFWTPLGTVICFGSLIAMVLMLTVLPATYWILFRNEDFIFTKN
jgi:multidrug efflux pump subunit AcrB